MEFLGAKTDTAAFYRVCDVFVLPSLWGGIWPGSSGKRWRQNSPLWPARSVVCRRSCGRPNGYWFHPVSRAGTLAQMLCRLIENPEERRAMGKAGRAAVEKYQGEVVVPEFERLYERLARTTLSCFRRKGG